MQVFLERWIRIIIFLTTKTKILVVVGRGGEGCYHGVYRKFIYVIYIIIIICPSAKYGPRSGSATLSVALRKSMYFSFLSWNDGRYYWSNKLPSVP